MPGTASHIDWGGYIGSMYFDEYFTDYIVELLHIFGGRFKFDWRELGLFVAECCGDFLRRHVLMLLEIFTSYVEEHHGDVTELASKVNGYSLRRRDANCTAVCGTSERRIRILSPRPL